MDKVQLRHGLHKLKLRFENKVISDPYLQTGLRNDVNVKLWLVYTVNGEPRIKTVNSIFYRKDPKKETIYQKIKFWRKAKSWYQGRAIYQSGNIVIDNREETFLAVMMEIPNRELVKKKFKFRH